MPHDLYGISDQYFPAGRAGHGTHMVRIDYVGMPQGLWEWTEIMATMPPADWAEQEKGCVPSMACNSIRVAEGAVEVYYAPNACPTKMCTCLMPHVIVAQNSAGKRVGTQKRGPWRQEIRLASEIMG